MRNTIIARALSFAVGTLLTLTLTACSGQSNSPSTPSQNTGVSTSSELAVSLQGVLCIGLPGGQMEVPYSGENTPEALIAALAAETGWDLSLAKPTAEGSFPNTLTVALAEKSGIYASPPAQQKDAYHVFEAQDWAYSVLNSISDTLCKSLGLDGVQFTAPDGEDLDFENGGVSFHLAAKFFWDYELAFDSNSPAPTDSVGLVSFLPIAYDGAAFGGVDVLTITCYRPGVEAGVGNVTVFNEDGSVFDTVDISDPARVVFTPATKEVLDMYNAKAGTQISIYLLKMLEPSKKYFVSMDAGVLLRDGIQNRVMDKSDWEIVCADYGVLSCSLSSGGAKTSKIGQPITYQITLGDSATAFQIVAENCDVSPEKLTQDGTVTVTPQKIGERTWEMYYEVDGKLENMGGEIVIVTE